MNVACPHCRKVYRVDPARVPPAGVLARCASCRSNFPVAGGRAAQPPAAGVAHPAVPARAAEPAPGAAASTTVPAAAAAASNGVVPPAARPQPAAASPARPAPASPRPEPQPRPTQPAAPPPASPPAASAARRFGFQDPDQRARRLARALISDILVYHREQQKRSLAAGTLRADFRDEIRKSWEEYVHQVGLELARSTPHFRDALNDILAEGQRVF